MAVLRGQSSVRVGCKKLQKHVKQHEACLQSVVAGPTAIFASSRRCKTTPSGAADVARQICVLGRREASDLSRTQMLEFLRDSLLCTEEYRPQRLA